MFPVVLVVVLAAYPDMVPIEVERYATEKECRIAAALLDASTTLALILTCRVDT